MKSRYRLFRRGWGTYYVEDLQTKKQETLKTRDKAEAYRKVAALNEATVAPAFSLHLARVYWKAGDPAAAQRTWQTVMDEIVKLKSGDTKYRWMTACKDKAFDPLRTTLLLDTRSEHFLRAMEAGLISTNVYLRRLHNFAIDMGWLPWPVLPKKRWPAVRYQQRRGVTRAEHEAILARETNPERKAFYQLAWHLGASQCDIANLNAEDIDWEAHVVAFARKKNGSIAIMRFDDEVAAILRSLPSRGSLFPYLKSVRSGDRATEFKQRCDGLNIKGVTLHSYRYAWAERARSAGYPERFAQEALGHQSRAVHRAYARKAQVEIPALSEFERQRALFTEAARLRVEGATGGPVTAGEGIAPSVSPPLATKAPQAASAR
jgi:integrase